MKRAAIAAVALAAMPVLVALWLSPAQEVNSQSSPHDEISVVGPEAKLVGDEFNVDVNISEVGCPYWGYQAYLLWDDRTLAYVDPPGVTYTGLGGMVLDSTPIAYPNGVYFGSARSSGRSTQTGTAARVRLKCIGTGTSSLYLVSLAQDPDFGTTMIGCDFPDTWLVDDAVVCMSDTTTDSDGDGCSWTQEAFGAPSPYPGSSCTAVESCYSDFSWYDFYDVPVPANVDPAANGSRDNAATMSDVLAVLLYVGTYDGGPPNPNGVDYDSDKDTDTARDGRDYDRSPSADPNPPWDAGPPDGAVSMGDVLAALAQVGLDCNGPP